MPPPRPLERRARVVLRIALSHYVTIGLSAAVGLLLVSAGVHLALGAFAGAAASVGAIVAIPPDQPAPRRGKFWQLLPAVVIGIPLFYAVQALHGDPVRVGLLLVPATFAAFLAAAWGKRGLPISVSIMFAMIFSRAVPYGVETPLATTLYFAFGAVAYLVYATAANALLNPRYRVQLLADTLLAVAALMRTQARQFTPLPADTRAAPAEPIGLLLRHQAALTDQLQGARNLLLESPRTERRQRLAGMLMHVLDLRDHLLACELDLEALRAQPGQTPVLSGLRHALDAIAGQVEHLADALLLGRRAAPFLSHRPALAGLQQPVGDEDEDETGADRIAPTPSMLARGLASRVGHIDDEVGRLVALARREAEPDLAIVRASWQMFVSPTAWSWRPFAGLWRWDAPPLRHAIRAALAIATGHAIAVALPWGTHDYWILLTIVVVLRGSLAQTLERRNSRVAGTLLGSLVAGALLASHAPAWALLLTVTLAQGVAHAFAIRRYLVTAVAATVLALLQSHLLGAASSPAFAAAERIADTLIGIAIAWAFSYVLPSWERTQIPALVARTLAAHARHARVALGLGQLQAVDNEPELAWRLARREAYDSLSALVQAAQRSLAEPRAVRPPLEPLARLLAHSYQLLAQLTAVKTMLLLRRGRLDAHQIRAPLAHAAALIETTLASRAADAAPPPAAADAAPGPIRLPDPFEHDLSPWLLRRLELAEELALRVRDDGAQVLGPTAPAAAASAQSA